MKLVGMLKLTETFKSNSKFELLKKIEVGDILQLSLEVGRKERGPHSGLYATNIMITNVNHLEYKPVFKSLTEVDTLLSRMKYEEIT